MKTRLRLLLIEDSSDDARLILNALARHNFEVEHQQVDNAQALGTILQTHAFDAVVADYNLPGFNGLVALQIVRNVDANVPFVLMSGTAGEEIAVQALKLGANDYVLKGNMARLGAVMARELLEAANRSAKLRLQADLSNQKSHFEQVLHTLPTAFFTCDAQGHITMFNDAAVALWGRTPVLGVDLWCGSYRILTTDGRTVQQADFPLVAAFREGRSLSGMELVIERPNGDQRHVRAHPSPIFDLAGNLTGGVNMLVDITDLKRSEQALASSLDTAQALFDESPIAQLLQTPFARINNVNDTFCALFGYRRDEVIGHTVAELALRVDDDLAPPFMQLLRAGGRVDGAELNVRRQDGSIRRVTIFSTPVIVNGETQHLHSFIDITQKRAADLAALLSQKALASVSQGVLITGADRITLSVNHAFELMTGYREAELVGRSCAILQGDLTDAETVKNLRRALKAAQPHGCEILNYRKDGTPFWNELSINPVFDERGQLSHFVGIQRDITQKKEQQAQLKLTAQVFSQAREGITVADASGRIIMVNTAFTQITGYPEDEVVGRNPSLLSSGRHDQGFYESMWKSIDAKGVWRGEIWNRRKDGSEYPEWLTISSVRDDLGQVSSYVGTFSDISEQNAARERIDWLSHFDALTGLPNRALLADRCSHDISAAQREGKPIAMMVMGIDHFKVINDTLSHAIGDEVLKQFAQRITGALRDQDTVARTGGDEFVLILPGDTPEGAGILASRLLRVVAQPYEIDGRTFTVTASIGTAIYPLDGQNFETLFKSAEVAMHQAKQLGRGKHHFFSAAMFESTVAQAALATALHDAIARDQLQLHYQPFADLQTGQIGGMEALLRWNHPELGMVPPSRFIPVAEQSGLIIEIGNWVFTRGCRDLRDWLDHGMRAPRLSINVSPVQFGDPGLLAHIEKSLRQYAIEPDMIYVEITEGALMEDVEHSEMLLRAMKSLGLRLALDDFGTGYSSLSYLKRFPFDKVKIDQSFVRDINTSSEDAVIAKVVISMAHGLGLQVIAEGVETEPQCEFLRANGCDEIQGYFFSRPIAKDAMDLLLAEDRRLPAHLLRVQAKTRTLLLVDDEPNVLASLKRLLRRDGYDILTANSGQEGLDMLSAHPVDIILSDQRMPGMSGVEFLRQAKTRYPDTIRIVLSGYTELQSVTDAINEGAVYRFLTKPWDDAQLRSFIEEAFHHKELADENRQLNLKIRTANHELATSNRQLQEVLGNKQRQIIRSEVNLSVVRDVLQHLPVPILGLDDDGMIAFVNRQAQQLFGESTPLLGDDLAASLPEVEALLNSLREGECSQAQIKDSTYQLQWYRMGEQSTSQGRIVTFTAQREQS